jgi:IMP dehydrogenase
MFGQIRGLTFDDVVLVPSYNGIKSRQHVTTKVSFSNREFDVPIVTSNMDTITESNMADAIGEFGGIALLHRFMSIEDNVQMFRRCRFPKNTGISIGIGDSALERAEGLIHAGAEIVCVDVAHGHSKTVNQTIKSLREAYHDNIMIVAGNVATYAGADYLAAAGADVIKVGIGSGSVCSTRVKTGFGVPQLSAISDCCKVDRTIIADGGIRTPSDVVKALAAGADMVMLGGLLAGTDETPGSLDSRMTDDGQPYYFKTFRGMASKEAQDDYMGGMAEWKTAEGVSIEVPSRGSMKDVIKDVMGGVRSGMTYCGAAQLSELRLRAEFMEITAAGRVEGTPHGQQFYSHPKKPK